MDQLESALERLRPKLILAFQFNLKDLADLMHGEGFLSDSDHQTVTAVASLHNESDKAGIMVKSLINKVKINGEHYQTFLKLVQPERRKYDDVVLLLTSGVSMTSGESKTILVFKLQVCGYLWPWLFVAMVIYSISFILHDHTVCDIHTRVKAKSNVIAYV